MAKNLVLCCDGTANEFAKDRTNVVKLFSVLVQDPAVQSVYYHPGLGTMEATGAVTRIGRRVTRLLGQAIGYGLEADIRDAYVFLMRHFEPHDRVFLFGFSRGAYTVRAVASLLKMYGLIPRGNEPLVPYAIRMMGAINTVEAERDRDSYLQARQRFQADLRRNQDVQAMVRRRVGHGELGRLDREPAAPSLYGRQLRHHVRSPRRRD